MIAKLLSRNFLSTFSFVFRKNNPGLPVKAGKVPVCPKSAFKIEALLGSGYLRGIALILAAANSLSHYYLPTTVAHDNNCGCL